MHTISGTKPLIHNHTGQLAQTVDIFLIDKDKKKHYF